MRVSLDGGVTYQDVPEGVRVIYDEGLMDEDENPVELHINCTKEGVVLDLWDSDREMDDESTATTSLMASEIVERLLVSATLHAALGEAYDDFMQRTNAAPGQ
jgi:hypothetical protein